MKTRYALKALAILADTAPGQPVLVGEIAERETIPLKFLQAILRELRQHGILAAQRGRGGGYSMRLAPQEVTLADVIRALEGPLAPVPCLSRTAYRRCDDCKSEKECGVRLVLRDLYEATASVLETTTVSDLVRRTRQAGESGAPIPSYSI